VSGSVVLNTAIGLVFVFLTASLICTAALEWISNRLNMRGEYLLRGLREMLDIPPSTPHAEAGADDAAEPQETSSPSRSGFTGGLATKKARRQELNRLSTEGALLADRLRTAPKENFRPQDFLADLVLAHPIVAVLHRPARPGVDPEATTLRSRGASGMRLASYVSAQTFASAVIDLLLPDPTDKLHTARLYDRVERLHASVPARAALLALIRDAEGDGGRFRHGLERWYDEQMGRVSGWYKRWAQLSLLFLGAMLAVVMNLDTLEIGRTLYRDEPVRQAVVAQALDTAGCPDSPQDAREECLAAQLDVLRELPLPVGWDLERAGADCRRHNGDSNCRPWEWPGFAWHTVQGGGADDAVLKLLGWLLTAAAISFGAPFWFDAIGKLGSLRTAGRRPGDRAGAPVGG
jgi:hypothetical protein